MTTSQILSIALSGIAVVGVLGAFAIAYRRSAENADGAMAGRHTRDPQGRPLGVGIASDRWCHRCGPG